MNAEIGTEHPHVVRQPATCGGAPVIRGSRISVRLIAELWNGGETGEGMLQTYPHLQASWMYDAISFYLDHRVEIDQTIEANRIENVLAKHGAVMDEKGIIRLPPGKGEDGE
jgi:uncharacterized protein (DUF433 family)